MRITKSTEATLAGQNSTAKWVISVEVLAMLNLVPALEFHEFCQAVVDKYVFRTARVFMRGFFWLEFFS